MGALKNVRVHEPTDEEALASAQLWAEKGVPEQLLEKFWSTDADVLLEATTVVRIATSTHLRGSFAIIQSIIDAGLVPVFVELLKREEAPELQYEAGWVLLNVAAGTREQTASLIDHGAVPILVRLLHSPSPGVREQAVWALGNTAADPAGRDLALESGALEPLLRQLQAPDATPNMAWVGAWALSCLCWPGGQARLTVEHARRVLLVLAPLITPSADERLLQDALMTARHAPAQAVVAAGLCPRVAPLLEHPSAAVRAAAVGVVQRVVAGNDRETQAMVEADVLPRLLSMLRAPGAARTLQTVCCAISNVAAVTEDQTQAVIDAGLIPPLLRLAGGSAAEGPGSDCRVRNDAAWAVGNTLIGGNREQVAYLVEEAACIPPLCRLLDAGGADAPTADVVLTGLERVVEVRGRKSAGRGCGGVRPGTPVAPFELSLRYLIKEKREALGRAAVDALAEATSCMRLGAGVARSVPAPAAGP